MRPDRHQLVDAAGALVLTVIGLVGFRTAFAGSGFLVTGVAAALAGLGAAHLALHLRRPVWLRPAGVRALGLAAVFVVLAAPLAFRGQALAGVVPSPASVRGLADGLVNGWARLLTSIPPSGNAGNVFAVPYLCGFAGTALALVAAARWPRRPLGVLPPLLVLAASILFGTAHPAAAWLQGAVFGVVALAWAATRADRYRAVVVQRTRAFRLGATIGLLAVSVAGALALGPHLPLASAHARYVLRDQVQPPFDPEADPSPLGAYRKYVTGAGADQELLVVQGLPAGTPLQVAVLDGYDGVVWLTTGSGTQAGGIFDRAGALIPDPTGGPEVTVTVTDTGLSSIWLPTAGDPRAITFSGPEATALSDTWRFDPGTEAAAVPGGFTPGARYTVEATVPRLPPPSVLRTLPVDAAAALPLPAGTPPALASKAADIVEGATDPYDQAVKLEDWFQKGYYSDGGPNTDVPPGHSLARLSAFLATPSPVGDAEQYAAAMGLLARALGLPVRVVVGFRPTVHGNTPVVLRGKDLDAWVEIDFEGAGWVPFYPTPPRTRTAHQHDQAQARQAQTRSQPPPPTTVPPVTLPAQLSQAQKAKHTTHHSRHQHSAPTAGSDLLVAGAGAGGGLALLLLLPPLAVVGLKARRRHRRRTRSSPAAQVVGAWDEVLDRARDLGLAPPGRATRREAAAWWAAPAAAHLAAKADAAVFGPDEPDRSVSAAIWQRGEEAVAALRAPLGARRRLRAALSLASLRRARPRRGPSGRGPGQLRPQEQDRTVAGPPVTGEAGP